MVNKKRYKSVRVGEKIIWTGGAPLGNSLVVSPGIYYGHVRWLGNIRELGAFPIAGVEMDKKIGSDCSGEWNNKMFFNCEKDHGIFLPVDSLVKITESCFMKTQDASQNNILLAAPKTEQKKEERLNSSFENNANLKSTEAKSVTEGKLGTLKKNLFNSLSRKDSSVSFSSYASSKSSKDSKSGFKRVLKWFSAKDSVQSKNEDIVFEEQALGSTTSLKNDTINHVFPLRQSASAENSSAMQFYSNRKNHSFSGKFPSDADVSKLRSDSYRLKRKKRRAPAPPNNNSPLLARHQIKGKESSDSKTQNKFPVHPVENAQSYTSRPLSSVSSFSSISFSGNSTIKSSVCSDADTLAFKSATPSPAAVLKSDTKREPISPKPWYKRKKTKEKCKNKKKENDNWMPDIQFFRKRITSTATASSDESLDNHISDSVGTRLSFFSSISDLDRAAAEEINRIENERKLAKLEHDKTFYQGSTYVLNQKDLVPEKPHIDSSKNFPNGDMAVSFYDNVPCDESSEGDRKVSPPSIQSCEVRSSNTKITKVSSKISEESLDFLKTESINSEDVDYDEYINEIKRELEQNPSQSSRETPKQRAVLDSELFYLLAKDAKLTTDSKLQESSSNFDQSSENRMSKNKNFGLRMNNIYIPDISTIVEASESVPSSNATATAVEETDDSQSVRSLAGFEETPDNDVHNFNEIIEKFNNALSGQNEARSGIRRPEPIQLKIDNSKYSHEEIMLQREQDNMFQWQKMMQETDLTRDDDESFYEERKKRWWCEACTLINLPSKIHCEACGKIRPPNPLRVEENGVYSESFKNTCPSLHNGHSSIEVNETVEISQTNHESAMLSKSPNSNWEKELHSYFIQYDHHANAIKDIRSPSSSNGHSSHQAASLTNGDNNDFIHMSKRNKNQGSGMASHDKKLARIGNVTKPKSVKKRMKFSLDFYNNNRVSDLPTINSGETEQVQRSPVLTKRGNVKNVVSVFNQMNELKTAELKPLPKSRPVRRLSNTFKIDSFDNISSIQGSKESSTTATPARSTSPTTADVDISSAILMFDEMAAIAEIEAINHAVCKNIDKSKPHMSSLFKNETSTKSYAVTENNSSIKTRPSSTAHNTEACSRNSIIKDGVLYTGPEHRRRSSICSGVFELLDAKEFSFIEARHSRMTTPTGDGFDVTSLPDFQHPLLMPEIDVTALRNKFDEMENAEKADSEASGDNNFDEAAHFNGHHEIQSPLSSFEGELKSFDEIEQKLIKTFASESRPHPESLDLLNGVEGNQQNLNGHLDVESYEYELVTVELFVEDRQNHQGPFPFELSPEMSVGMLKQKIFEEFGFPVDVQRLILGRSLAKADEESLSNHGVSSGCSIFVYLVAPNGARYGLQSFDVASKNNVKIDRISKKKYKENKNEKFNDGEEFKSSEVNDKNVVSLKVSKQKTGNLNSKKNSEKGNKSNRKKMRTSKGLIPESVDNNTPDKSLPSKKYSKSGKNKVRSKSRDKLLSGNEANGDSSDLEQPSCSSLSSAEARTEKRVWICTRCTLRNLFDRPGCEACCAEKPVLIKEEFEEMRDLTRAVMELELQSCVPNSEPFTCSVCFLDFGKGNGVVLRDCLHVFCRPCLRLSIMYSEIAEVKCPYSDKTYSCESSLQDREIKNLLTEEEYRKHLDKSVMEAAGTMQNVFYCRSPDCKGFCQYEDNVNVFVCEVCSKENCLTCQTQHVGLSCKDYQDSLTAKDDEDSLKTKKFFDDIIRRGNGMACPQCSVMLIRKWGCDWMRCPMCRTEICWVTRGPRWGPKGTGDTSGGCRCGVNGRRCHPKCTHCH